MSGRDHFIDGRWVVGSGMRFGSHDSATARPIWDGHAATTEEVDWAMTAARRAAGPWAILPVAKRTEHLLAFAHQLRMQRAMLAETIAQETGKPMWESLGEVDSMIAKVGLSVDASNERRVVRTEESAGAKAVVRYKPHGVLVVLGPYNFPGHLPNGHIVPALLAGNTVVFKPSELTPLVAVRTLEIWEQAHLPSGVLNMVQGDRETGTALVRHRELDGLLFTGSVAAGQALHRSLVGHPEKLLALEMGGNNPLVVWNATDTKAAVYMAIQSAFLSAGQRCSCARRLIVKSGPEGDRFVEQLAAAMMSIHVGVHTERPEPFMGPVISEQAAEKLLEVQNDLRERGGSEIVPMTHDEENLALLRPGLMDVSAVRDREDAEYFGPFLQLIRVNDFASAIAEANNTAYGLCAGLLSDSRQLYDQFYQNVRAGIINWNRPTTGASSRLPFGGMGISGNHRPSGYFASDYCSEPVTSLETEKLVLPSTLSPGIEL